MDKTALEALFKSLDLGSVTRVERISGGVVNGVYFVDSDAGGSYVLRLASKHMFGKEVSGVGCVVAVCWRVDNMYNLCSEIAVARLPMK